MINILHGNAGGENNQIRKYLKMERFILKASLEIVAELLKQENIITTILTIFIYGLIYYLSVHNETDT